MHTLNVEYNMHKTYIKNYTKNINQSKSLYIEKDFTEISEHKLEQWKVVKNFLGLHLHLRYCTLYHPSS